jgi:hypothetical protein
MKWQDYRQGQTLIPLTTASRGCADRKAPYCHDRRIDDSLSAAPGPIGLCRIHRRENFTVPLEADTTCGSMNEYPTSLILKSQDFVKNRDERTHALLLAPSREPRPHEAGPYVVSERFAFSSRGFATLHVRVLSPRGTVNARTLRYATTLDRCT